SDGTGGFVAPQSQSACGYAPSSRLATGPIGRNAGIENSLLRYQARGELQSTRLMRKSDLSTLPSSAAITTSPTSASRLGFLNFAAHNLTRQTGALLSRSNMSPARTRRNSVALTVSFSKSGSFKAI